MHTKGFFGFVVLLLLPMFYTRIELQHMIKVHMYFSMHALKENLGTKDI